MTEKLMAVTRTSSKGSPLRMTLPKEVAEILNVGAKDHVGFYEDKGRIVIRRID